MRRKLVVLNEIGHLEFWGMNLGVVPIFVSAGTALLPAIVAGVMSVLAVVTSPRAMWGFAKRRPLVVLGLVAVGVGAWMGGPYVMAMGSGGTAATEAGAGGTDWAAVAREILQKRSHADVGGGVGVETVWRLRDPKLKELGWPLSTPLVMKVNGREAVIVATAKVGMMGKFGVLYGVDLQSGEILWRTTEAGEGDDVVDLKPFFSSPTATMDGKNFVIGQGLHDDADSALLCVSAQTGKVLWSVGTPLHVESTPAVYRFGSRDLAVVGVGAIEGADRKPTGSGEWSGGYVLCVDARQGKELWRHKLADAESSPAVDENGVVYIGSGFNGNAVVALRSESDRVLNEKGLSREVWRVKTDYPAVGDVTLAEEGGVKMVLIGAGNGDMVFSDPKPAGVVVAMERGSGKELWRRKVADSVLGSMAVVDGMVIAGCRSGEIFALRLKDGELVWTSGFGENDKDGAIGVPILGGITVRERTAYVVNSSQVFGAFDVATGKRKFTVALGEDDRAAQGLTMGTPVASGDLVIVGTETGGVRAMRVVKKEGSGK